MASIINNIYIIWKFYIANIGEDTSDGHRKDILEVVFQNSSYFYRVFIIK